MSHYYIHLLAEVAPNKWVAAVPKVSQWVDYDASSLSLSYDEILGFDFISRIVSDSEAAFQEMWNRFGNPGTSIEEEFNNDGYEHSPLYILLRAKYLVNSIGINKDLAFKIAKGVSGEDRVPLKSINISSLTAILPLDENLDSYIEYSFPDNAKYIVVNEQRYFMQVDSNNVIKCLTPEEIHSKVNTVGISIECKSSGEYINHQTGSIGYNENFYYACKLNEDYSSRSYTDSYSDHGKLLYGTSGNSEGIKYKTYSDCPIIINHAIITLGALLAGDTKQKLIWFKGEEVIPRSQVVDKYKKILEKGISEIYKMPEVPKGIAPRYNRLNIRFPKVGG